MTDTRPNYTYAQALADGTPANRYGADGSGLDQFKQDFINKYAPYAMLLAQQTGIPARSLLSEIALETGWGRSASAREDNNLFGVKAPDGYTGKVAYRNTNEYDSKGNKYVVNAPFIVYDSPGGSFQAFADKLQKTGHTTQRDLLNDFSSVSNLYGQNDEAELRFADAFKKSGYLTNPAIIKDLRDAAAQMPADFEKAGFNIASSFLTPMGQVPTPPSRPTDAQLSNNPGTIFDEKGVKNLPVPPGRPEDGSAGITPRPPGVVQAINDASDAFTQGLEGAGNAALGAGQNAFGALGRLLGIGGDPVQVARPDDYGALAALYQQDTGRSPDVDGFNYWSKALESGQSLLQIDQAMRNSAESKAYLSLPSTDAGTYNPTTGAGALQPSDILSTGYNAVFGRAVDASGSDYFSQPLQNGSMNLAGLMDALRQSPEYAQTYGAPPLTPTQTPNGNSQTIDPLDVDTYNPLNGPQTSTEGPRLSQWQDVINNAFQAELQRAPDADALSFYGPQVQAGTLDAPTLDRLIKASPEWKSMHSTDAPTIGPDGMTPTEAPRLSQYASTLGPLASEFATLTGRPLDATGGDYFTQQVQNGTPQSILEAQLLTAPEVQAYGAPELANLVNNYQTTYGLSPTEVQTLKPAADQFASVLGRPVDTPTLQYWDSQIDAGKNMPTILAQMLQAPEVQAQSGSQGYQTAVNAFGSQYGINPADYLGGMLMGPGGVTGVGNGTSPNGGASNAGTLTDPASLGGTGGFANTPSLVGDGGVTGLGNQPGANVIDGLYRDILGRGVDAGGQGWLDKFNQGSLTLGGVANALTQSDEYKQNHPGGDIQWDADYNNPLQDIFARQLGRIGDTNSMGYWLNQMGGGGQDLNAIFKQIGTTPEAEAFIGSRTTANPWQAGITYRDGSVFHDGVNLGAGALFDPVSSEKAYLNTQVNQINQGAAQSKAVENQLTRGQGVPMPTFAVNGTDQGNNNAVGQSQLDYLNQVNSWLAAAAPAAPAPASFAVGMPNTQVIGARVGTAGLPF